MNNYDISIIVPVFFRHLTEENSIFLERALRSIGEQSYPAEYEVILIDDGSPSPIRIPKNLHGSMQDKINLIRLEANQGLVNALNTGLKNARYPLIARIDADDWWEPNKIEKQIKCFQQDPDLTLVATGMTRYDPAGNRIDTHIREGQWDQVLNFFIEVGCPFPHGSILAKKEIFELLGFYPYDAQFIHCEDYALWGLWLRFFKAKIIEESLLNYTVWNQSVSYRHSVQQQLASRKVHDIFAASVDPEKLPRALIDLSKLLNISLIQAGKLSYLLWRCDHRIFLPNEAIVILDKIIPDRVFLQCGKNLASKNWQDVIRIPHHALDHDEVKVDGQYYSI
jgi:glycosyltransferase involved in cell wall biosynthesis